MNRFALTLLAITFSNSDILEYVQTLLDSYIIGIALSNSLPFIYLTSFEADPRGAYHWRRASGICSSQLYLATVLHFAQQPRID